MHFFDGDEPIEAGADGSHGVLCFFVERGFWCAWGVAACDGRDVQAVGVGMRDAAEDMADAEVDEAGGEGCFRFRGRFGLLGGFLLLFLFGLLGKDLCCGGDVGSFYGVRCCSGFLGGFALADDEGWLDVGSGCEGLFFLFSLFLFFWVEWFVDEEDGGWVDGDFVGFVDGEFEYGGVLYEVDVSDNMMVAALSGSFFR